MKEPQTNMEWMENGILIRHGTEEQAKKAFGEYITPLEFKLRKQLNADIQAHFGDLVFGDRMIQYSWKGGDWCDLRIYPTYSAEWELDKLKRMYSWEYDFRILKVMKPVWSNTEFKTQMRNEYNNRQGK